MKIRVSFVSNSSSSSFIVIGRNVGDIYDNLDLAFKNKQYAMIGKYITYDEADDFIILNEKLYKWLKDRVFDIDIGNGTIIEIIKNGQECWSSDMIKIPDNLKDACAWLINASDHSSRTIEDLEDHYLRTFH